VNAVVYVDGSSLLQDLTAQVCWLGLMVGGSVSIPPNEPHELSQYNGCY